MGIVDVTHTTIFLQIRPISTTSHITSYMGKREKGNLICSKKNQREISIIRQVLLADLICYQPEKMCSMQNSVVASRIVEKKFVITNKYEFVLLYFLCASTHLEDK